MKLKTKVLYVTDAAGNEIDLDDIPVQIYQNGSKTPLTLDQLLVGHSEFDEGEIYGQTLLSLLELRDDGKLYYENSYVELVTEHGPLRITGIERPGTTDDERITLDHIREFSKGLGISHPDKLFADLLSDDDKQTLASEFNPKAQAAADPADAERKADAALRAQVKPEQLYDEKKYRELLAYYKDKKCKQYVAEPYHIFFGNPDEEPCLFITRTKNLKHEPDQTAMEGETDKELVIQFDDLGTQREVVLNTESGEIKLKE